MNEIDWMLPLFLSQRWGPGWGTYEGQVCAHCGHRMVAVARIGTRAALVCERCGASGRRVNWETCTGRFGDGVWL